MPFLITFIKTIFALVDPTRPKNGERIARALHYVAASFYVVEWARNALAIGGSRCVNQCNNGFNKQYLLSTTMSIISIF